MIAILKNERGITLLEILATAAILVFAITSVYIGIIYAEKQMQRNYHDRIATLLASGELDWQKYYLNTYKEFDEFPLRQVLIDRLQGGRLLYGKMSIRKIETYEVSVGQTLPYTIIEISVTWNEPGDRAPRKVVVREDFY